METQRLAKNATQSNSFVLLRAFTEHPASVDETYFAHMRFASRFSFRLFAAAAAAGIHAVLPFLFEKTASNQIKAMFAEIDGRGDQKK